MAHLLDPTQLKRRTRLYAQRGRRMAMGGRLRYPCLFMHLPKCGGTSLAAGLYGTVPLHQRIGVIDAISTRRAAAIQHFGRDDMQLCHEDLPNGALTFDLRESLMLTHMAWGSALIHGHVLFSDKAAQHFAAQYRFVTMMRDPVDRAMSNFHMAVRAGVIENDLDTWLGGPVGRSMAQVYLRYFSGQNVVSDLQRAECLARAQKNLDTFHLIGFLDNIPGFCDQFADMFSQRPTVPHYNAAGAGQDGIISAQRAQLEALCAPDYVLYEQARAKFGT